jgi:hypothetical protein
MSRSSTSPAPSCCSIYATRSGNKGSPSASPEARAEIRDALRRADGGVSGGLVVANQTVADVLRLAHITLPSPDAVSA